MNAENDIIIRPVIDFLERDLIAIQRVYNLSLVQKTERREIIIDNEHIWLLTAAQARIEAAGDPVLCDKFDEYSRKRLKMGNAVEIGNEEAFEELEATKTLASDIIALLIKRFAGRNEKRK